MPDVEQDAVVDTRASFLVLDDSYGFNKTLTNYGFTVHFTLLAGLGTLAEQRHAQRERLNPPR